MDYFYDLASDPDELNDVKSEGRYKETIRTLCDELERIIRKEEHIDSHIIFG